MAFDEEWINQLLEQEESIVLSPFSSMFDYLYDEREVEILVQFNRLNNLEKNVSDSWNNLAQNMKSLGQDIYKEVDEKNVRYLRIGEMNEDLAFCVSVLTPALVMIILSIISWIINWMLRRSSHFISFVKRNIVETYLYDTENMTKDLIMIFNDVGIFFILIFWFWFSNSSKTWTSVQTVPDPVNLLGQPVPYQEYIAEMFSQQKLYVEEWDSIILKMNELKIEDHKRYTDFLLQAHNLKVRLLSLVQWSETFGKLCLDYDGRNLSLIMSVIYFTAAFVSMSALVMRRGNLFDLYGAFYLVVYSVITIFLYLNFIIDSVYKIFLHPDAHLLVLDSNN